MTRAPSTLPFSLQPNPSPAQVQNQKLRIQQQIQFPHQSSQLQRNQRFISNICRTGPLPTSKHNATDVFCLILYVLFIIATLTLFLINYFSCKFNDSISFAQLNLLEKLSYSFNQTLPQTMLSCACLIVVGIIFLLLVLIIPVVVGYLMLLCSLCLLGFIMYSLIVLNWGNVFLALPNQQQKQDVSSNAFKISMIVLCGIGAIILLVLIFRRLKKLKHLGAMMKVVKVVLMANLPLLPFILLFIISGINMGLWCGFSKMLWTSVKMSKSGTLPIPHTLVIAFIIVLWLWTHGFFISISDYICQSWVLHWYFNAKNQQNNAQGALKQSWRSSIFKKLIKYHLGTCIFASVVTIYFSDLLIRIIKRFMKYKSSNKNNNSNTTINTNINNNKQSFLITLIGLSRYFYTQTIMQNFNFCTANHEMYMLRQRIKQKIPEIYMLGHFLEQVIKIMLPICAIYLWFQFTYNMGNFLDQNVVYFNPIVFFIFCLIVTLGIFLQISTNIGHIFGLLSDTAVIAYSIDCQIQRVHFNQNIAHSVPDKLKQAFINLHINLKINNSINTNGNTTNINNVYKEQIITDKYDNLNQQYYLKEKSQVVNYQPLNQVYH